MSRLQVLIMLAAFVATPVLRMHCEHPCASLASDASTGCHGSTDAPVKLVDGHDCSTHVAAAVPAVPVSKETRSEFRFSAIPVLAASMGDPSTPVAVLSHGKRPDSADIPTRSFSPLRI